MGRTIPGRAPVALIATLVLVTTAAGCALGGAESDSPLGTDMVSCVRKGRGFTVTLRAQPGEVPPGGDFSLTLTVRNLSGKHGEFALPTAQTFEFRSFVRGGSEAWRYGRSTVFSPVATSIGLQPGDSLVFKLAWDTAGAPPGPYSVEGWFAGLSELRPVVPVEITAR